MKSEQVLDKGQQKKRKADESWDDWDNPLVYGGYHMMV